MNPASDLITTEAPNHRSAGSPVMSKLAIDRVLAGTALAACLGLLAFKFVLSTRLNVNWDEFYFLSHVHSLLRGDLERVLLGVYTHLFTWLTRLSGDEMEQIVAARRVMLVLLCVTTWLVWQLARKWLNGFAAIVPCFVYLSAVPVVIHGGSFRFDSMLAPLSMAALLVLWTTGNGRSRNDWLAGLLIGLAMTISMKAALLAPLFLAAIVTRSTMASPLASASPRLIALSAVRVAISAGLVAGLLIALHSHAIAPGAADALAGRAGGLARQALVEVPWFPRIDFLEVYVRWQPLHWLLIALGTLIALARRRFDVASLSLALLPIAFYRNAFPYYYVVMLAPAAILAGYAIQEIMALVRPKASAWVASALLATIWLGLMYQGIAKVDRLLVDDQVVQKSLLSGIHEMFPEPVNYVDRCGMVPSFRKVNFFISTWGVERYRRRGEPFMPATIQNHRPAFILENSFALNPTNSGAWGLLPEDRELIAIYYPRYWGPVRVAGAQATLSASTPVILRVPFPDRYRISSNGALTVDGVLRANEEIIIVPPSGVTVEAAQSESLPAATSVKLFLAVAGPRPARDLPPWPLFAGL